MQNPTDLPSKSLNARVQNAFRCYFVDSFSELTQSEMHALDAKSISENASHVSVIEVATKCGTVKLISKIHFQPDPTVMLVGASSQSNTSDVCNEAQNWFAGWSRDALQSLGMKSKQSFPQTLLKGADLDVGAEYEYKAELVLSGAGVILHCSVYLSSNDESKLEKWPETGGLEGA